MLDVKSATARSCSRSDAAAPLAESLLEVANGAGLPTAAVLTDMTRPLGEEVGNALEVRESIDFLTGRRRDARLAAVTAALAAELLVLGGLARDVAAAGALVSARSTRAPRPSASRGWCPRSAGRRICSAGRRTAFRARRWSEPWSRSAPAWSPRCTRARSGAW